MNHPRPSHLPPLPLDTSTLPTLTQVDPANASTQQLLAWQCELLREIRDSVQTGTQERQDMWHAAKIAAILSTVAAVMIGIVIAGMLNAPRY